MPDIPKYQATTGQCWECFFHSIDVQLGGYCGYHKAYFPNQFGWAIEGEEGTKAGERTCKFWKVKIIKVQKFKKELFVRDMMQRKAERGKLKKNE